MAKAWLSLLAIPAVVLLAFLLHPVHHDWYNEAWPYRLTISLNTPYSLSVYDAVIELNSTNFNYWDKFNCSSVRFTTSSNELLDFYTAYCNETEKLAFFVVKTSLPSQIYMYFRPEPAESLSNGTKTFLFFADASNYDQVFDIWYSRGGNYLTTVDSVVKGYIVEGCYHNDGCVEWGSCICMKATGLPDTYIGNTYRVFIYGRATDPSCGPSDDQTLYELCRDDCPVHTTSTVFLSHVFSKFGACPFTYSNGEVLHYFSTPCTGVTGDSGYLLFLSNPVMNFSSGVFKTVLYVTDCDNPAYVYWKFIAILYSEPLGQSPPAVTFSGVEEFSEQAVAMPNMPAMAATSVAPPSPPSKPKPRVVPTYTCGDGICSKGEESFCPQDCFCTARKYIFYDPCEKTTRSIIVPGILAKDGTCRYPPAFKESCMCYLEECNTYVPCIACMGSVCTLKSFNISYINFLPRECMRKIVATDLCIPIEPKPAFILASSATPTPEANYTKMFYVTVTLNNKNYTLLLTPAAPYYIAVDDDIFRITLKDNKLEVKKW